MNNCPINMTSRERGLFSCQVFVKDWLWREYLFKLLKYMVISLPFYCYMSDIWEGEEIIYEFSYINFLLELNLTIKVVTLLETYKVGVISNFC